MSCLYQSYGNKTYFKHSGSKSGRNQEEIRKKSGRNQLIYTVGEKRMRYICTHLIIRKHEKYDKISLYEVPNTVSSPGAGRDGL